MKVTTNTLFSADEATKGAATGNQESANAEARVTKLTRKQFDVFYLTGGVGRYLHWYVIMNGNCFSIFRDLGWNKPLSQVLHLE